MEDEGTCVIRLHKDDILEALRNAGCPKPELVVSRLGESDMEYISRKLSDAIFENGYWEILIRILDDYMPEE